MGRRGETAHSDYPQGSEHRGQTAVCTVLQHVGLIAAIIIITSIVVFMCFTDAVLSDGRQV